MVFEVVSGVWNFEATVLPCVALALDAWDDWFQFSTMYTLFFFDSTGERHRIGSVKIGQFGMKADQRRAELPKRFESLDDRFFSLGQDDSYYDNLNELGSGVRDQVLESLRDIPFSDPSLLEQALNERVTTSSLLRSVTAATVNTQFRRIARGGARLSRYSFAYSAPGVGRAKRGLVTFNFDVTPDSQPPTNIHVIIGRNGVGKTHLLNAMSRALVQKTADSGEHGQFEQRDEGEDDSFFANLVSVTFSAFDPFEPLSAEQNRKSPVQFA